jgi:hypothetical protein
MTIADTLEINLEDTAHPPLCFFAVRLVTFGLPIPKVLKGNSYDIIWKIKEGIFPFILLTQECTATFRRPKKIR